MISNKTVGCSHSQSTVFFSGDTHTNSHHSISEIDEPLPIPHLSRLLRPPVKEIGFVSWELHSEREINNSTSAPRLGVKGEYQGRCLLVSLGTGGFCYPQRAEREDRTEEGDCPSARTPSPLGHVCLPRVFSMTLKAGSTLLFRESWEISPIALCKTSSSKAWHS